jgi:hypothetical protein
MTCESSFSVSVSFLRAWALRVQHALLDQFGLAGLHRKVGLGKSNFGFARVTVLRNQVARIAGEHDVVDFALAAGAQVDHFPDVRKMVVNVMSRDFASCFGLEDDIQEVFPFGVAQQMLDVPCKPVFNASFGLLRMALKVVGEGLDQLFFHGETPILTSGLTWR